MTGLYISDVMCSEESCYALSQVSKKWHDFVRSCPMGTTPVKITSQYEQDVVAGFSSNPWIGKAQCTYV